MTSSLPQTLQTTDMTLFGNCSNELCSNSTSGDIAETLRTAIDVLSYINYFLLPLLLVLGLTGNTLTIIIMQTKRFTHLTSRIFLIALALSDSVLLLTQPFNKNFILTLFQTDLRALSNVGCKAFFVIFKTAKMSSSWFLVFICWERFVAVWFPLKAKLICTKRVAVGLILAVYIFIFTYTSVWSYASQITPKGICHPDVYDKSDPNEVSRFGAFLLGGLSIYSLIPMCFLITMTPMIALKLTRHGQKRKSMVGKSARKATSQDTNRTTIMLVGVMVAYILLISPVTALHMSAFFLRVNAFGSNALGFLVFKEVSQILEQINYAINFFLYVLTSSMFRQGFKEILHCNRWQRLSRATSSKSSGSDFQISTRKKYLESENVSTVSK
ncbi:neuromedin-U receptor 2-like [Crassostrea angulata]|uniref:neuromedin-U receptor 2-like n=1 Tax=Magallana angulata TaxID=2784310 RepID=UPI0022B0D9AB|nr:neuromedin-U receptor 2-like [Crassostrea angulata]